MKPLKLTIEDFLSHRHTEIDYTQFSSALIVGKNKNNPRESNGVGKTSIPKAIEYVLFGSEAAKDVSLDKFVRDGTDKCCVTFDFETNEGTYRVRRSRSKKSNRSDLRLYRKVNDDWEDFSQKTSKETDGVLAKIVKISHTAFHNSILFAQSDLKGLATASAKERKNILKEPLQLSNYGKYEKLSKDRTSTAARNLDRIKAVIQSIGNPEAELASAEVQLSKLQLELTEKESEVKLLNDSLVKIKSKLSNLESNYHSDFSSLEVKYKTNKANLATLDSKISSQKELLRTNEIKVKNQRSKNEALEREIRKLNEALAETHNLPTRNPADVQAEIKALSDKEVKGLAWVSRLETDIKKLSKPITSEELCSECNQQVTEEHRKVCEEKRIEELSKTSEKLEEYKNKLNNIRVKKRKLELELKSIEECSKNQESYRNKLEIFRKDLENSISYLNQLENLISEQNKSFSSLETERDTLCKAQEEFLKEIKSKNPENVKKEIIALRSELSNLEAQAHEGQREVTNINMNIGATVEKIKLKESEKEKIVDLNEKLQEAQREYSITQKVTQAFSPSGIPTMIINTILDDLQLESNNLLSQLRPGMELQFKVAKDNAQGQLEDTLDISYRVNGYEREYEQLSGGQKLFVALALKLGLSLVIQHRLGININFLILDEVDQPLDRAGVDAFAQVIAKWQEKFNILVITHNDYLKDKFKYAILVESDGKNGSCGKLVTKW